MTGGSRAGTSDGRAGSREEGDHRWRAIAPGRVNLIGEHVDHNGLPVLPIAIDRGIRVDFRALDEPVVRLGSPSPRFPPFSFRLTRPIEPAVRGDWSNYVRAAARGLLERGTPLTRGVEGTVTGDVPIASGLASSSALVVASALALLRANGVELEDGATGTGGGTRAPSRLELAALMARAERLVGLEGGGMDQAACLHGVAGHALRIGFDPLRVTPVRMPGGWRWVVASSLARAEKSRGARAAYNERARQCREALTRFGWSTYRDLLGSLDDDVRGLLRHARRALAPVLFRRLRHVVTEGRRVDRAVRAMRAADLRSFGELMTRSHASLRDDYEVSTDALDQIVAVALEAGAAGARLTGAGFGGCAVALCDDATVEPVMEALATRFYAPRGLEPSARGDVMFIATPARGARVTRVAHAP